MDIVIRRLTVDDAKIAALVIAQAKSTCHPRNELHIEASGGPLAFLRERRNILIAAILDEQLVGFAIGYVLDRVDRPAPMVLLYEIEVIPAQRRRGIARGMIQRLREVAREVGAYKMWVLTEPENEAARGLYRATDGQEVGVNLLIEYDEGRLGL